MAKVKTVKALDVPAMVAPIAIIAESDARTIAIAQATALHVTAAHVESDGLAEATARGITVKRQRMLTMQTAWSSIPGITETVFETDVRKGLVAGYMHDKGVGVSDTAAMKVIGTTVSNDKVAIIALSNQTHMGANLLPNAGEILKDYIKRVRPLIQAFDINTLPLMKANASGAPKKPKAADTGATGTDAPKQTRVTVTREAALHMLCNGDLADMQMLDKLTANNMGQIRGLFAMLYPVKS